MPKKIIFIMLGAFYNVFEVFIVEKAVDKIRFICVKATNHYNSYFGVSKFEAALYAYESLNLPEKVSVQEAGALASYFSLRIGRKIVMA